MSDEKPVKRRVWKQPEVKSEKVTLGVSFSCSSVQTDSCGPGREFCAGINDCINCGESCEPI